MSPSKPIKLIVLTCLMALLTACGGGGGGTGAAAPGGAAIVSSGVMTKGSVIVNGVRYEDNTAKISIDDTPKTAGDLKDGMVVKVRGRRNDDGITGTADSVEVENEVRGLVQSTNASAVPPSFVVVNQTVRIDQQTIFSNFSVATPTPAQAIVELGTGTRYVEVHGLRDQNGVIRASRVEILNATPEDELRGRVSNLVVDTSFTLATATSNVPVVYSSSSAPISNGDLVEVHGVFNGTTFSATRVDHEDSEDSAYEPKSGDEVEYEGLITEFAGHPGTFKVAGRAVETNNSTRFEGGISADLADNVRVEVEGHSLNAGALVVDKVKFKGAVRIVALAASVDVPNRMLTVMGKTVRVDDFTDLRTKDGSNNNTSTLSDIVANTDRVEVRGHVVGGEVIAERLQDYNTNSGSSNDDFLQATVEVKTGTTSLTMFGIVANLSGTVQFRDLNDQTIDRATFFAAVHEPVMGPPARPGTLVKVRFNQGTFTATEAELENQD